MESGTLTLRFTSTTWHIVGNLVKCFLNEESKFYQIMSGMSSQSILLFFWETFFLTKGEPHRQGSPICFCQNKLDRECAPAPKQPVRSPHLLADIFVEGTGEHYSDYSWWLGWIAGLGQPHAAMATNVLTLKHGGSENQRKLLCGERWT